MPDSHISATTPAIEWEQLSLLREEVVEVTLRLGFVVQADHMQWQITVRDPSAGALLGMLSSPATSAARWERQLITINSQLSEIIRNHVDPF